MASDARDTSNHLERAHLEHLELSLRQCLSCGSSTFPHMAQTVRAENMKSEVLNNLSV